MTPSPDPPGSDAHVERLRVRYSDTDAQGIAHHSNHFRWMEEARIGWLAALGHPYAALNGRGIFIPLVRATCAYRAPVRAGDPVAVHLRLATITRVRAEFTYRILSGDVLIATAQTSHAIVGADGRPRRLSRDDPFWCSLGAVPPH